MAASGYPWTSLPGPRPEAGGPEAVPCARCGHRADSHLHQGSCSVRSRWWRRCRCGGYTRVESADYSPGAWPRSSSDR